METTPDRKATSGDGIWFRRRPDRAPARARIASVWLAALCVLSAAGQADAERVFVRAASGQEGHAWLFGAEGQLANACWLAVPKHVIADPFSDQLLPFTFEDRTGTAGESGVPIAVGDVPGALEAAGGIDDLAFAPVVSGRATGECLSRLGLPKFAYESIIKTAPEVTVFSLVATSYGVFQTVVSKARSDAVGGGLMELRALDRGDAAYYFKQGLSGAVGEVQREQGMQPFAMILQVDPEKLVARAARFDLIRAAFEVVERDVAARNRTERAISEGVPYRVVSFEGLPVTAGVGPSSLLDPKTCWKVAAEGGSPSVAVTIELADANDSLKGLTLVQAAGCDQPPAHLTIQQRVDKSRAWSVATECQTVAAEGAEPACRLDLSGPRQLRIVATAGKPLGLSYLRLF